MTSKEKVLKVLPGARPYECQTHKAWEIIGGPMELSTYGVGETEEAAWQNAAESLSAQPEQDDPYACSFTDSGEHAPSPMGNCVYCSNKGRPHKLRPVAAVEANEKDLSPTGFLNYVRKLSRPIMETGGTANRQVLQDIREVIPEHSVFIAAASPSRILELLDKCADSSSISTEPEQVVSFEELAELYNSFPVGSKQAAAIVELQRWRMKGQSNGH